MGVFHRFRNYTIRKGHHSENGAVVKWMKPWLLFEKTGSGTKRSIVKRNHKTYFGLEEICREIGSKDVWTDLAQLSQS